jgi:predicted ATP-grasp superfamily ATP-dependent carboligase
MHNPIAALAIIKTLTSILGIKIDTGELAQMANDTREKMKQLAAEAMEEYIDYFTEPIWERSEGFNNEA